MVSVDSQILCLIAQYTFRKGSVWGHVGSEESTVLSMVPCAAALFTSAIPFNPVVMYYANPAVLVKLLKTTL